MWFFDLRALVLQVQRSGEIYERYCSSWSVLDGLERTLCKFNRHPTPPFEPEPLFLENLCKFRYNVGNGERGPWTFKKTLCVCIVQLCVDVLCAFICLAYLFSVRHRM